MRIALAAAAAAMMMTPVLADARTWRVAPGPEAQTELQHALSGVEPGDTVRLDRGRYELTQGLTLAVRGVEVRGEGQDRTVLSFAEQQDNAGGLTVTGPGALLRDFAVEDTRGDAIQARDCNGITMRAVRAEWTRGANVDRGGYGLRAVNCSNVLIEDSIARGAIGAGIAVSNSRNIILRRNIAERNTAGLAVESSNGADLFENTAQHNAGGVALMGTAVRVFSNTVSDNDAAGRPESFYAEMPTGTGVFVMAAHNAHIFENEIGGNATANVIVMANPNPQSVNSTFPRSASPPPDPNWSPLPNDIMIRDNRFGASGASPAGAWAALGVALPDVIWDGANTYFSPSGPRTETPRIVMRDNRSSRGGIGGFLSLGLNVPGAPLSEAAPDPAYPPLLEIEEPERVRID